MQRRHFLQMAATGGFTAASGAAPAQALPIVFPGAITDVAGIKVGHFTETRRPTGCTVILTEQGAVAGVDVRGSAPGTRETDLLNPTNLVEKVHAILLAGGSAFGLDAASGVVRYLEERNKLLQAQSNASASERESSLAQLQQSSFSEAERPRLVAYE